MIRHKEERLHTHGHKFRLTSKYRQIAGNPSPCSKFQGFLPAHFWKALLFHSRSRLPLFSSHFCKRRATSGQSGWEEGSYLGDPGSSLFQGKSATGKLSFSQKNSPEQAHVAFLSTKTIVGRQILPEVALTEEALGVQAGAHLHGEEGALRRFLQREAPSHLFFFWFYICFFVFSIFCSGGWRGGGSTGSDLQIVFLSQLDAMVPGWGAGDITRDSDLPIFRVPGSPVLFP